MNGDKSKRPKDVDVKSKRQASVYDAVAGRVSAAGGFIQDQPFVASTRHLPSSSSTAAAPETVLFRRRGAPDRFEETDVYFAHESLPRHTLPDSDMLKAFHAYASDFYASAMDNGGVSDWRSMDETALLAFGILMEEMARDVLGETGDLVFTERAGSEVSTLKQADVSDRGRRSSSEQTPAKNHSPPRKRQRRRGDGP